MIEIGIGIAPVTAGVVKRQLAAVDAVLAPRDGVFLRDQVHFDADFPRLIGDDFAHLVAFEMAVRSEIKLDLETVGLTCFAETLPGAF